MRSLLLTLALAFPVVVLGSEDPRITRDHGEAVHAKHFVLTAEHTLRPDEKAALAAAGVEIQQVLTDRRYIVRASSVDDAAADPRVASIVSIEPAAKISRSAYREAAQVKSSARVRLVFHDDVSYADAVAAIARVGGSVDQTLASDYVLPQRLQAHIPVGAINDLAADDRVFAIYGPPLKIAPNNAVAASLSHVTQLFTAPYNLSGAGVVASEFEFAMAASDHPEFGGRLITHVTPADAASAQHATHVAGTIIAAGVNPQAKGMAPAATLHEFDVRPDYPIVLDTKQNQLPQLGVVADNNSWGFQLGWQFDASATNRTVWFGDDDFFGGYDSFYCAPYDKLGRTQPTLFVHSAGNDGDFGNAPLLSGPWFGHGHVDDNGELIKNETFCYSQNGSGTDCPAGSCSSGPTHCEKVKHATYGPYLTIGPTGSLKNTIAVGATDSNGSIASFSSRGPTRDGRVKPDLVAKGVSQFSTWSPAPGYQTDNGTSMSSPVVTGIATLLTELWRKTFNQNPPPLSMKAVLIAGADDRGLAGPDYTYGFGLVNAQASADLIIADANSGARLRTGNIAQGQTVEYPFTLTTAAQKVRVVLAWFDPEVAIPGDEVDEKTLVNDLDVRIVDPSGNAVLAYTPDPAKPDVAAGRGVNTRDNVEEVEMFNAAPGNYKIVLTGTTIASGPAQQYVVVANTTLAGATLACNDSFEPNDTEGGAFGNLVNRSTFTSSTCTATDVDFYRIRTTAAGPLTVSVTTSDTAVRVTLTGNGITPVVADIAAGATGSVSTTAPSVATQYIVKVEPVGTLGTIKTYTLTPTFSTSPVARKRTARH
jgi:hypothetical protein